MQVPDIRVLIVDDQPPFRAAACEVVALTEGFVVVGEATSGEASLEEVRKLTPDLVIMDVNLPGLDGIEATRRLTGGPAPPAVLLVSTYDEQDYAGRAAECGAVSYLPKAEFGPDALAEAWGSRGV